MAIRGKPSFYRQRESAGTFESSSHSRSLRTLAKSWPAFPIRTLSDSLILMLEFDTFVRHRFTNRVLLHLCVLEFGWFEIIDVHI